ncbi:hypothetical protein [Streptomyces sp. NRRL S-1813]|uniref:hypothetical protein n=1 Tax=Streptomyces sp. NRRL S-1813 TaxID=1463888 RepID=UPI0004CC4C62|nr:hypothetical protein [Streptomyces sp. NRRL S-1813]
MAESCEDCESTDARKWWPPAWPKPAVLCFPCALRRADSAIPDAVVEDAAAWCRGERPRDASRSPEVLTPTPVRSASGSAGSRGQDRGGQRWQRLATYVTCLAALVLVIIVGVIGGGHG